jgi:hypothetical protein
MVLSCNAVEYFAKIAMTALQSVCVTMCLLPYHDPLRLIILERAACDLVIRNWARSFICEQNFDSSGADGPDIADGK